MLVPRSKTAANLADRNFCYRQSSGNRFCHVANVLCQPTFLKRTDVDSTHKSTTCQARLMKRLPRRGFVHFRLVKCTKQMISIVRKSSERLFYQKQHVSLADATSQLIHPGIINPVVMNAIPLNALDIACVLELAKILTALYRKYMPTIVPITSALEENTFSSASKLAKLLTRICPAVLTPGVAVST